MRRILRRDERAFAELVERYGARLLVAAHRLLGSRQDGEDAVQRTFLRCYTSAAQYRPRWAVSTWIYRILTNVCVDEMRRRATRSAPSLHEPRRAEAAGPLRTGVSPGRHIDLRRALERVPREARVLLALRYVDGLSYAELARARGISVNTVKSQLARAKSILRGALGAASRRGGAHR